MAAAKSKRKPQAAAPKVIPHPRLYLGIEEQRRACQPARGGLLRRAASIVCEQAEEFVGSPVIEYARPRHNELLMRARIMQTHIVVLLLRWLQTGEERFRLAVLEHVREMHSWQYWSWITWREGDARPEAIFDLSYGENCSTLAIAYDWLHHTLSDAERQPFIESARDRAFLSFLHNTAPKRRAWWYGKPDTNWNTVCAGGAGMLALAMLEDLPEAAKVLARADESVRPFMALLDETGGGWPEGIGYWNYGFRYAFMYLLSYERATGQRHPSLRGPGVKASLGFPIELCPNGVPCSFGDVNHWQPYPFHYAAAVRLGRTDLIPALDARTSAPGLANSGRPNAAELLLLHPRGKYRRPAPKKHVAKLFRGLDWGVLADRWPAPRLYLSIRGGTTEVPHGHMDLLSFHAVVGDEALISNVGGGEYLDSTFSQRRFELFEMAPPSKNTILINGIGIDKPSAVKTQVVRLNARRNGIRLVATEAMGGSRSGAAAKFCGRLFLMLEGKAVLIVDRVDLSHPARLESRFHSYADVTLGKTGARLRGKRQRLSVSFAATVPAALHTAVGAPTTPGVGATMLRWCSRNLVSGHGVLATLLTPGGKAGKLKLREDGSQLEVHVSAPGLNTTVRLGRTLKPVAG